MIFHWHFNLHFPVISNVEHLYMCLLAVCIFSLEKCLLKSFVHILIKLFSFLLLNCRSSLYILDSNPLSAIWVTNIVFYLFTLLIVSFDAQKVSVLMWSNFSIFTFVACALDVIFIKSLPSPMSWNFFPVFSSKSFRVSPPFLYTNDFNVYSFKTKTFSYGSMVKLSKSRNLSLIQCYCLKITVWPLKCHRLSQ